MLDVCAWECILPVCIHVLPFLHVSIVSFPVKELTPEFYSLPDFLVNANHWDLGDTQKGVVVDDVQLPPWAKGCAHRFVRMHRAALESPHVSANLHKWCVVAPD